VGRIESKKNEKKRGQLEGEKKGSSTHTKEKHPKIVVVTMDHDNCHPTTTTTSLARKVYC
jgi:hypothetical protein